MSYLLDTHVLLWALSSPEKLSPKARRAIENRAHKILVSAASLWEISIKKSLGKLRVPETLLEHIAEQQFDLLDINAKHVVQTERLPLFHKDPFDRLLIAQTQCEKLTLITRDTKMEQYPVSLLKA